MSGRGDRGRGSRRGARGGFGRGRGRRWGGRGRGRSQSRDQVEKPLVDWEITHLDREEQKEEAKNLNFDKDVTGFFVGGLAGFEQHYEAQKTHRSRYLAALATLEENGVDIDKNARVRGLAAAWARADHELGDALLYHHSLVSLSEVLKAVTLLDAGRKIRVLEKRLKQLNMAGAKLSAKKMGKFKSDIDNLSAIKTKYGSASGAVAKHVQKWVRTLTKEELEFFALHLPKEPWQKLADICHFNSEQDFPNAPWFLPYCFGGSAPEGSLVLQCQGVEPNQYNEVVKEYQVPYSHLKEYKTYLNNETKGRVAAYTPLDQVLWYYEDLSCPEVDKVVCNRLDNGHQVALGNGKLMERMLTLKMIREDISLTNVEYIWKEETEELLPRPRQPDDTKATFFSKLLPMAQKRLEAIRLPLESPIVVMGDKSGSMDIAIRISTIIASLLTAITSAKLVFFNTVNKVADFIPKNIEEVLEMAVSIEADAATAPAASLYPFYTRKEVVKTFIIVTDEEENEDYMGHYFLDLYKKYHDEVYPAKLVFVSFLPDQHAPGKMVTQLEQNGFKPLQFKFSVVKPDLTKLDKLFGLLSSRTGTFDEQLVHTEQEIIKLGIKSFAEKWNAPTKA